MPTCQRQVRTEQGISASMTLLLGIRLILVGRRRVRSSFREHVSYSGAAVNGGALQRAQSSPSLKALVSVSARATGHAANTPATTAIASPSPSPINRRQSAFQCTRGRSSSRLQPKKRPLSGQLGPLPVPADFKRMRPPLATSCKNAGRCVNPNNVEQAQYSTDGR
jgi:hypothetical protein